MVCVSRRVARCLLFCCSSALILSTSSSSWLTAYSSFSLALVTYLRSYRSIIHKYLKAIIVYLVLDVALFNKFEHDIHDVLRCQVTTEFLMYLCDRAWSSYILEVAQYNVHVGQSSLFGFHGFSRDCRVYTSGFAYTVLYALSRSDVIIGCATYD